MTHNNLRPVPLFYTFAIEKYNRKRCASSPLLVYNCTCSVKINRITWGVTIYPSSQMSPFTIFILELLILKRSIHWKYYTLKEYCDAQENSTLLHRGPYDDVFGPLLGVKNIHNDVCSFTSGRVESMFMDMFANHFRKFGITLQLCPFSVRSLVCAFNIKLLIHGFVLSSNRRCDFRLKRHHSWFFFSI